MRKALSIALVLAPVSALAAQPQGDPTEAARERCLAAPSAASTAGQTSCEAAASRSYDKRMNSAYKGLIRRLPAAAARELRATQRAWLAFRSADDRARTALYETRQGTMYAPMQAAAASDLVRDRARQLEASLRVLAIEGQ